MLYPFLIILFMLLVGSFSYIVGSTGKLKELSIIGAIAGFIILIRFSPLILIALAIIAIFFYSLGKKQNEKGKEE